MATKKITINADSVLKGWSKSNRFFASTNTTSNEAPEGFYNELSEAISIFRSNRLGHISPGETFTALTDAGARVTGLPLNGVVRSDAEMFAILDNARIVQFGVDDVIDAHNATAPGATRHSGHASISGEDILAYRNATDEYILYSWNDDTDGDVGRLDKATGTYDDDWLSGLGTQTNGSKLTKAVPHELLWGKDGNIYIANGNYVAKHVNASDAIDYQAFQVPIGFTVRSIQNYGDRMAIVCDKDNVFSNFALGESKLLLWDFSSTQPDFVYDIGDSSVSKCFTHPDNGLLYVWTIGRNGTQKVKVFNGSTFDTIAETIQLGNPPRYGSVGMFENKIHFAPQGTNGDGKIACIDGLALHDRCRPTAGALPSAVGMVKNLTSRFLYAGSTVSGTSNIYKFDINGYWKATNNNAYFRSRLYDIGPNATIKKIRVYTSQFGTGASFSIQLVKGYNNAQGVTGDTNDLVNYQFTNATSGAKELLTKDVSITQVQSFYIGIIFDHSTISNTAAIIRQIEIEYETGKS